MSSQKLSLPSWFCRVVPVIVVLGVLMLSWQSDVPVAQLQARYMNETSRWVEIKLPKGQDALGATEETSIRLHVRDEGPRIDPEPIVLLHGTGASLHTWDGWADQLKATRRVVRLDLPGNGLTGPFEDHRYGMDRYSAVLSALADQLQLPPALVVGNSLGGFIAWEHAVRDPKRVSRLILIDSAGYSLPMTDIPIAFTAARTPVLKELTPYFLTRMLIKLSLENVYAQPSKITDQLVMQYYDLTTRAGNRRALVESFEQRELDSQTGAAAPRIKQVKQPTLILWGEQDLLIPPRHAQLFLRDIPRAKLVMLPGLDHVPMEEDPQASLAAARAFIDDK